MGRYRTITQEVDVDIYVGDILEELEDDELIEELKRRKCNLQFLDFSFPAMDDTSFRSSMVEAVSMLSTDRCAMLLEAIRESYHYPFLKDPQP
jgi:hypothetical protein